MNPQELLPAQRAAASGAPESPGGSSSARPQILVLGPARTAVGGVSTHLNHLFESNLSDFFRLRQYQVGSAGRAEGGVARLLRLFTSSFGLAAGMLRDRPSIVHINTSLDAKAYWRDITYMAVAKVLRRKVVYQVHGGPFANDFFPNSRVLSAMLRHILSWADVVVLLSSRHMKTYGEFAPIANLQMIPYGVEIHDVDLSFERYAPGHPLEIVNVGRLVEAKGIFEIIEAVRILRSRRIAVRVKFVGSGPDERALRRSIIDAGLGDRVELLGPVFGAAKQQLWSRANVLALPTYSEGLPLALLEGMSAGCVPVTTPVGGIPDAVQDHVNGRLVSPRDPVAMADTVQELHEDREGLRRMAIAGRQRIIDRYSRDRFASDFRRLYADLV